MLVAQTAVCNRHHALEPVMILVMGAIVLLIVLAILLPIIEIKQLGALTGCIPAWTVVGERR